MRIAASRLFFVIFIVANCGMSVAAAGDGSDAEALYKKNCAECHGSDRLGAMGPALLPQNLKRLKRKAAVSVIENGSPATQMPAFHDQLSTAEIQSLVEYIYTPLEHIPRWGIEQMRASHVVHYRPEALPDKPLFSADLQNLFIVVELADHHATLLDGDTFTPIHRFPTRFALHGGPKYSNNGRYVFFASRDGWISKFDIYNLKYVAEIRAGINTRNIARCSNTNYYRNWKLENYGFNSCRWSCNGNYSKYFCRKPIHGITILAAPNNRRICFRSCFYGYRPGIGSTNRNRKMDLWISYWVTGNINSSGKSCLSGRNDAGHFIDEYLCTVNRLLRG